MLSCIALAFGDLQPSSWYSPVRALADLFLRFVARKHSNAPVVSRRIFNGHFARVPRELSNSLLSTWMDLCAAFRHARPVLRDAQPSADFAAADAAASVLRVLQPVCQFRHSKRACNTSWTGNLGQVVKSMRNFANIPFEKPV